MTNHGNTSPPLRPLLPALALAALVLGLDQLTKAWILDGVMVPPRAIPITSFFDLVLVRNLGVSFGLFSDVNAAWRTWVLIGLAGGIGIALLVWLVRCHRMLVGCGLGLALGGAIGNVIDRVRFGAVTDFLDFHLGAWHWPAFNLADSAITVGVALIVIDGILESREHPSPPASVPASASASAPAPEPEPRASQET